MGVRAEMLTQWFEGVELPLTECPPVVILPDYPSVVEDRQRAAVELDRLAALGKIHWYEEGSYPPDLRVCPSHLIVKGNKNRMVHDWSCAQYPLNALLVNRPVEYGAMDGFLSLLSPGAFMGGVDLQDCFLHWPVAPAHRRFLGVRHPTTGVLGVYLFLPFGLGPSPGINDGCVKEVLSVVRSQFPSLRVIDFVDDVRLVEASGEHDALAASMTGMMSVLDRMGVRYHTKEGKRWWPTRVIPWLGFEVDMRENVVRMEESKVAKGQRLCEEVINTCSGAEMSARELLAAVSFLNFLHWVAPGGFCHLRSGWDTVNRSGIMDLWRAGARSPSVSVAIPEDLRNDMVWWWRMLERRPAKNVQFCESGGFAWHARLPRLRELALAMSETSVVTLYTDASGRRGWGATLGDLFIQGRWSKLELREGINWKELWVLNKALETWHRQVAQKLILVRMDNSTAVSYANYGAGRVGTLTALARRIKDQEAILGCTVVALHIAGSDNAVADALSRFSIRVRGLDPFPERALRWRFRKEVALRCGRMDVDMMASDDGHNAWVPVYRSPSNSALEGPLPWGRLWWFPRYDMVDLVVNRILASVKENWFGCHILLVPLLPWKPWVPKLSGFERVITWDANAPLFVDSSTGHREWLPSPEDVQWAVFRLTKDA